MRITVSESTALRVAVSCDAGHRVDVWYINTPSGVVMELEDHPHQFLPKNREESAYVDGNCCFRAACEKAWELGLHV
jgi:hypothetical protein